MAFSSIIRTIAQAPLTLDLQQRLATHGHLRLTGASRLPKGIVISGLAQAEQRPLCVVTATLEEAGRWATQLETMGWSTVHFYPTSESSPYEPFDPESEMVWGQLQVLADLVSFQGSEKLAIVTTERALQPHLPPRAVFETQCLTLEKGMEVDLKGLSDRIAELGYERVSVVETEGRWSRRGDIVDIFPVASELPVRLEWFGDELTRLRELDPSSQRSLEAIAQLTLTPTSYSPLIRQELLNQQSTGLDLGIYLDPEDQEKLRENQPVDGLRRFLGLAFAQPASLVDYLPANTLVVLDEVDQCQGHSDRWGEHVGDQWRGLALSLPPLHRSFGECLAHLESFATVQLSQLQEDVVPVNSTLAQLVANPQPSPQPSLHRPYHLNLASRPFPAIPHQFARMAETIREERDRPFAVWLFSAQPSRTVSLLQEHDCHAQFVPNPRDYPAIDKLKVQHVPIALKYSGQAELEGFILPTFRLVVVTDREFFGQHSLASPSYVRKRRRAASKQVDLNTLQPGDYVAHRNHGVGRFMQLESLTLHGETRDYLVVQYADGLLRVAADQVGALSRFRGSGGQAPQLNKLTGKAWEKTKAKAKKAIQKVAVDLLKLYAQRSQQQGFAYPADQPWQQELEDSFPYQATSDQLKAVQDVKLDMESDRPMDRLVCGDVGFGKTEVAIRAIFKAVVAGKQCALLAPTTILTQQHYHTLKERFAPYPIQVGLLNRFRSASERRTILQRLETGELDVVVGTHQLLGKAVNFKALGMLVVDEEQRFGVNQKEKIKTLKTQVDVLTLSATPIPRTLYMTLSGVREMSLITTPPPSRRPIQTHLAPHDLETVRSAVSQELDRGGQVFYVVPRVEGIETVAARVQEMVPSARMAIAHGQMDESELEATMLAFSSGEADVMVCTTIIESGLDIPRVNTILIEDAQYFGLSQLYQLRGRVGRAGIQAHAWLFYPSRDKLTDKARKRLRAIQEFATLGSGYQLAMRDMEIRGVGNLLGVEQSGQMETIGFDLYMEMLEEAVQEIRGQKIPTVTETQIDLNLTAFIPGDYIPDADEKMSAYRSVATAKTKQELVRIAADWADRYGAIPGPAQQMFKIMELKQLAKTVGFARIKPEGQHVVLETPMEEPAWTLLKETLDGKLHQRFVYTTGKVTVRGLGVFKVQQQVESLIEWLGTMQKAVARDD
ncbi:transcription-repair coupling factor [Prochlorothrix hollandica]|uniref:Transcription-repair-coupling factor n=1 Tax=Prochlorothrix hollandica PCC 9006 = CALU 1027 TaxID=317619 RepID=A0A0M2Q3F6_PROHO|nr:transcription-repair coupling factor [Prochlorothrix hollandica]KKJ01469.1 transcription-repair coupling factor [Prochlorothrix hollandica PCC 9006 = CALU 1027]